MTNTLRLLSLACVLALTSAACDESLADVAGPTPGLTPTLSSIQRDIFASQDSAGRLACTGCHTNVGRNPAGGLNLVDGASYGQLVGVASTARAGAIRVVAGSPENSYLLKKLEGAADIVGVRMPRSNGPYLTEGQIRIIRRWIELGAKND